MYEKVRETLVTPREFYPRRTARPTAGVCRLFRVGTDLSSTWRLDETGGGYWLPNPRRETLGHRAHGQDECTAVVEQHDPPQDASALSSVPFKFAAHPSSSAPASPPSVSQSYSADVTLLRGIFSD